MISSRATAELPITLDRNADASLTSQLVAELRAAIDRGALRPNEAVPATRGFATRLGIARGVVVATYEQLTAEGYLVAGHGRGTRVADAHIAHSAPNPATNAQAASRTQHPNAATPVPARPLPLAPGVPDTTAVDRPAWRTAWRHAVTRAHLEAPELGNPQLRAEIAEHLRRMRGTTRDPADIIITAGAREGLTLLLTVLGAQRSTPVVVGVEDPGYASLRRVAARFGAQIVALPADADGLDPSQLPDGVLDAVIVTPSHQYPLGGSLPLARRRELLAWAHRTGAVIIEDDYDSELRHSGSPLPALAALDDPTSGSVVLLGTFSKTVSQALAAGFLLAPQRLRTLIEPVRQDLGGPVSAVVQAALAEYLASGELRRHTARMRRRYAIRRERVVEVLGSVPGIRVRPMSGGLHAVLELVAGADPAVQEARLVSLAHEAGLGVVALSAYWHAHGGSAERYGLVIGTGGPDTAQFEQALQQLRSFLHASGSQRTPPHQNARY